MFDPRTRKRTRRRRQKIYSRKIQTQFNWFLAFLTLLLWGLFGFIILNIEPSLIKDIPFSGWYGPFFFLLFLSLLALTRLLSGDRKRALLISTLTTVFLILRLNQLGFWYNGVLLILLGGVIEYFWISRFNFNWIKTLKNSKNHQTDTQKSRDQTD